MTSSEEKNAHDVFENDMNKAISLLNEN